MKVSGQLHAPAALLPGKESLVHTEYEVGRAPEPVWTLWKKEHRLFLPGMEPPFFGYLGHYSGFPPPPLK